MIALGVLNARSEWCGLLRERASYLPAVVDGGCRASCLLRARTLYGPTSLRSGRDKNDCRPVLNGGAFDVEMRTAPCAYSVPHESRRRCVASAGRRWPATP